MTVLQALILGFGQALTEFLPVSSSAHLVILPHLFGWTIQSLVFDTVLHLGTLCALLFVFGKDFYQVGISLLSDMKTKKLNLSTYTMSSKLGFYLILACIPAIIAGLLLEPYIENQFRRIEYVIVFLTFGTLLLFIADFYNTKNKESGTPISAKKALIVGIFQIFALFPGVSRSGSTISAGMLTGLSRLEAAKFSFMLSVPMVFAAASYELLKNYASVVTYSPMLFLSGFVASFAGGILVIKFLLGFLSSHSLKVFIFYRLLLIAFLVSLVV
jgi:undecaprenyl-diphosphatase